MNQNERALFERLQVRYAAPEWALLNQVSNGTGYRANRWIDALAMNLYPSRGLAIHGFEMKASRSDWLRELKDPAKAEEINSHCNFWWVVAADKDVVRDGELPLGWGLLVPHGKSLQAVIPAVAKPTGPTLPRSFVAAVLRRAHEAAPEREELAQAKAEARDEIGDELRSAYESRFQDEQRRREDIVRRLGIIQNFSGLSVNEFSSEERLREVGERIKAGLQLDRTRGEAARDALAAASRLELQAGALRRLAEEVATE